MASHHPVMGWNIRYRASDIPTRRLFYTIFVLLVALVGFEYNFSLCSTVLLGKLMQVTYVTCAWTSRIAA